MRLDLDWQYREGRDGDGDIFRSWVLVHASGRILGKVSCPVNDAEFQYFAFLYVKVTAEEDLRFIDLDGAKRFIEKSMENFEADYKPVTQKNEKSPGVTERAER